MPWVKDGVDVFVLAGREAEYAYLGAEERGAIKGILRETMAEFRR
jgi:hypothetical protein